MSIGHDVVIVGAGIVGAACAAALAREGHRVTVLDGGPIGSGATGAGMGHIVVMDDSPAQLALTSYSRRLWQQLAVNLPDAAECDNCGTIWIAADEAEMAAAEKKQTRLGQFGVSTELLDQQRLRLHEPHLCRGLAGGLRVPDDLVIYPPTAAQYLIHQAEQSGAQFRSGQSVHRIDNEGRIFFDDSSTLDAGIVVVAAGSWTGDLVSGLQVRPRKGHLVITDRYPGFIRHQLIELGYLKSAHTMQRESVAFNIQPRKTGQMLIGSSRQFDADDTEVETPVLSKMLQRAVHYLPDLARLCALRAWTGYRAATEDKLPLIGPSVASSRIWLATGHEGLGIATSLGTARLLADQLAQRATEIPVAPYLPARCVEQEVRHE